MNSFWSWFVIVLTVASLVATVWLMYSNTRRRPDETADTTGHTWDGDLQEYNNPLPRWWLGLFYLTIVFGVVYLVLYPGLGNFDGVIGWSQTGQYRQEVSAAEARYGEFYARFADMELAAIAADEEAMAAANNIFGNNCAQCHGSDGRGGPGFPNLTDANWQWGGSPEQILATLRNGRMGVMPAQAQSLGPEGVEDMVAYVRSLSGAEADPERVARASQDFATICAACHGPEGHGNDALGAPDLTDEIWLYGGDPATIRETLNGGRSNQMPAQLGNLGEDRVRLMAAYVMRISGKAGD